MIILNLLKTYYLEFAVGVVVIYLTKVILKKLFFYKNVNDSVKKNTENFSKKHATPKEDCDEAEGPQAGEDDIISAFPVDTQHIQFNFSRISNEEMIKKSMEFYEQINKRRTVRFFSNEHVPEEVIRNVIRAAGTSPSGAHTEPWTYVMVKDSAIKKQIREVVEEEEYINYTRRMGKQWTTDLKFLKTNWEKEYLTDAPYLILVFKQMYSFTEDGIRKNHYYHELSVAISTGILITAINSAGLVSLVSTPLQCGKRLREILQRPESERLVFLLPVGLPAASCTVPDLSRKPLHDISAEF